MDSPSRGARADTPFGRCWPSSASMPPQPGFPHLRRAQVVPFTWRGCLQASLPRVLPVPWSSEIHACLPPPRFEGTPPIPRGPALPPRPSALPPHPPGFVSDNPVWVCVPSLLGLSWVLKAPFPVCLWPSRLLPAEATVALSGTSPLGAALSACGDWLQSMSVCSGSAPRAVASSSGRGLTGPAARGHCGEPGRAAGRPQHGARAVVPSLWAGLRSYPLRPVPRG